MKRVIIKVNESKKVVSEETKETYVEPTIDFFPESSTKSRNSDDEESEADPEEYDPSEQHEQDSEVEPEEDPEEISEEELSREQEEDSALDSAIPSLPCSKNERNSSLNVTTFEPGPSQFYQSHKKSNYEESFKQGSDVVPADTNLHRKPGVSEAIVDDESASTRQRRVGESGKQKRSRWEPQPERVEEIDESNESSKKRKTRWDSGDPLLNMPCPIKLLDFMKDFTGSDLDPKIASLKVKLREINSKLQSSQLHDDMPKEARLHNKLVHERQRVLSKLMNSPTFQTRDKKPAEFFKKLYIPVKEYPAYNFVGLIIGPRGHTQKKMEKETGAKILLRGEGSQGKKHDRSDNEDLHVLVEADDQKSLDAAVAMIEKLLIPIEDGTNEHKRAQLRELALLNGKDEIRCNVCKDLGHKQFACPQRQSVFNAITCDTCGSFGHPTSNCPLTASAHVNNPMRGSGLGFGSTVDAKCKSSKEISEANLFIGYLPQSVDDNRLKELFSPFGKITESKVIMDRTTNVSKGYGFVKFENPDDAAAATMHMSGYKIDGKMLVVRVAGRPQVSGSSALSSLPMYPGPPAVPSNVPIQTTWLGPPGSMLPEAKVSYLPGSMLPEAKVSFPGSGGFGLPCSSIYMGHSNHLPRNEAAQPSPPSFVSSLSESKTASGLFSPYTTSNQISFSSPVSYPKFPGDPNYPGSRFL